MTSTRVALEPHVGAPAEVAARAEVAFLLDGKTVCVGASSMTAAVMAGRCWGVPMASGHHCILTPLS